MNAAGHLTPEEAAALARGGDAISPAERLAISDHAAACAVCRALLADARAGAVPPNLAYAFTGLIEAGRQEENPALEPWAGAEEFTAASPASTSAEREKLRAFETRLGQFDSERFVPGGTLEPARTTARQEVPVLRTAAPATANWWDRLLSWQSLTLAGAMAAIVLVMVVTLPHTRNISRGPVATRPQTTPADLFDGPVQVSMDGTLAGVDSIPADLREAVAETIRRGAAPGALLGKLTRGMGPGAVPTAPGSATDPSAPTALSPVGTSVETDQPVFRWKTPGPTAVQIVVRPSAGGEEIRSVPLSANVTEWTPPTQLSRGALYRWQVVPVSPDGQEIAPSTGARPGAVFKVLSADTHARLESLRAGSSGQSHLTLGVAYAREGLREESAREFRALQESNAQSVLAKRLVDSLEGRGG